MQVYDAHRQQDGLVTVRLPGGTYLIDGVTVFLNNRAAFNDVVLEEASALLGINMIHSDGTLEQSPIEINGDYHKKHPFITPTEKLAAGGLTRFANTTYWIMLGKRSSHC
jgi:hypothetical protein